MDGDLEYLLAPDGDGTQLVQHMSLYARGFFSRFAPMLRTGFHRASERRLESIKRHLESGGAPMRRRRPLSWPPDADPTATPPMLVVTRR